MPETVHPRCGICAQFSNHTCTIVLCGNWLLANALPPVDKVLAQIELENIKILQFDIRELQLWDSLLLTELIKILNYAKSHEIHVDKTALPESIQRLLVLVYASPDRLDVIRTPAYHSWFDIATSGLRQGLNESKQIIIFLGDLLISCMATLRGKSQFRKLDLWLYIQECGPAALPIVSLISMLVGLILAFVGALQLSMFGAQIYIANLVCLGMTREMGGLMTAVIMAGRTGAAYAAQLGTMQVNNEIDALKTMNLEPLAFLVLPRMLALILIMPLLCLYADLMGILGGGLVSVTLFDISLTEYLDRSAHAVKFKDFMVGFVKSSVFGILIAFSGCLRGMQSGRSASAVGQAATSAVVTSILFIVIADSIMTIICNRLGI